MKIENSHVNMASTHNSYSYTHVETATIDQRADGKVVSAIMELSADGEKSLKESLEQYQKNKDATAKENRQKNLQNMINQMAEHDK